MVPHRKLEEGGSASQGLEPVFGASRRVEVTQPHLDLHIDVSLNLLSSQML